MKLLNAIRDELAMWLEYRRNRAINLERRKQGLSNGSYWDDKYNREHCSRGNR